MHRVTPADALLVAGAGLLAGAVNAAAGGGSLLSFPVLVVIGHPALAANVTNATGLLPGYLTGVLGYRPELSGQGRRARQLLATAGLGAGAGCALLLGTPAQAFRAVVPWLILSGCFLLAAQPALTALLRRRSSSPHRPAVHAAVFVGGVYGAYFGAALGVMLLAALAVFVPERLQRLNALKAVLSLGINLLAVAVFALLAPVDWTAAGVLAVTSAAGGAMGARVARRLPDVALRIGVVVFGVGVAIVLLVG